ncbi:hypothetical protein ACFQ08_10005 [Streptosporangium algeriense]|uniref:Uncharacterized protein n=1 Tax=Streptosporangium algeriense TaxID=1682748 RepID=A0ABW3DLX0_9ACTN
MADLPNIDLISALSGATIASASGVVLQWSKGRREDRKDRERTVVKLLTAAVMLQSAVQAFRTAWIDHRSLRNPARMVMADYNTVLVPRLDNLVLLLADVSLWRGWRRRRIVSAARTLSDAAGELVEASGAKESVYRTARLAFNDALGEFRKAADRRRV